MRLSKTDGGVGYAYLCDGVSPASPVLSDGQLSFTPGLSQTLGTPNGSGGMSYASHFYAEDGLGNLRGMSDGGGQGFPDAYNWDGFGQLIGRAGGTSTPFGYGEASGYQTDGDSGLRLLGHRYYDSRTGRFISQDPAGDGDNWYAYCDNDPVSAADPTGLQLEGSGPSPFESMAAGGSGTLGENLSFLETNTKTYLHTWQQTASWGRDSSGNHLLNANGSWEVDWHDVAGSDTWAELGSVTTGMGGSGMFAQSAVSVQGAKAAEMVMEDTGGVAPLGKPGLQKEAEELSHIGNWGKGTYNSAKECAEDHFKRKGADVNAENLLHYLRKAEGFSQNLKCSTQAVLENGATRFTKGEMYIIKDIGGLIVSFGKAR